MRIAVVGGGITGLATAERLGAGGHDVVVIEPETRTGGLVRSERREGFLCETGPQAILSGRPDTRALVAAAGLEPRVIWSREATKRRFVYVRGALRVLPSSPPSLLKTDLLSAMGKLRLAREPFVATSDPERDESVFAFCERRFGAEAARAIGAPAVIGVYAGDAAQLSVKSALPRLWELEQKHGSVLRGALAERGQSEGPSRSFSFPEGLEELPRALGVKLGERLVRGRAAALEPVGTAFRVHLEPGGSAAHVDAERVVLATPAAATAKLLAPLAPAAAAALAAIPMAPVAVAALGFRAPAGSPERSERSGIGMDLAAYGFIVARGEGPTLLGCQYESSIFEHRAPPGAVLLRALLGGTFEPAVVDETDDAIAARAVGDLRRVAGLRADPDFVAVWRHRAGIPQYDLAHAARVRAVADDLARRPGLHVVGQATTGVGVNDCIVAAAALARGLG